MKEKLKALLTKQNLIYFGFILICFLLFLFDLKGKEHSGIVYLLFVVLSVFVVGIIFLFNYFFKKIEYGFYYKFYFVVVIVIGVVFTLIAPPFMGSDEKTHFLRVYEISEGHLISSVDENGILSIMPRSLNKAYSGNSDENVKLDGVISYDDIPSRINIPLEKENELNYCTCNLTNYFGASLYSPFQYLPHLVGVEIGKILNLGPTWILYLARICNLLFFALLTTIGIKLLPKFKLPAILILLSPVVLSGATTVSADGVTNAVIFLFIAYIANIIFNKKDVTTKEKIILGILTFMIAMCKIVYIPVVTLVFLLPKESFKNKKTSLIFKILLFIFGIIASLSWLYISSMFLNSQSATSSTQIHYIFTHLVDYIIMIVRTYATYIDMDLMNIFFGNQLYHWQLKVYPIFSIAYVVVIVMACFTEKAKFNFSNQAKTLICLIGIIIIGLISTALFVQNNVGTNGGVIGGIQARYFMPICFLVLLLLNIKKSKFSDKFIFVLFSLLYLPAILTIVLRFV